MHNFRFLHLSLFSLDESISPTLFAHPQNPSYYYIKTTLSLFAFLSISTSKSPRRTRLFLFVPNSLSTLSLRYLPSSLLLPLVTLAQQNLSLVSSPFLHVTFLLLFGVYSFLVLALVCCHATLFSGSLSIRSSRKACRETRANEEEISLVKTLRFIQIYDSHYSSATSFLILCQSPAFSLIVTLHRVSFSACPLIRSSSSSVLVSSTSLTRPSRRSSNWILQFSSISRSRVQAQSTIRTRM